MESTAIVRHQQTDAALEWRAMREQAQALVESGFLPRAVNTPEKALAIMQTGKELGLGPMQALRSIHIIEGKPTMSADLIAGLALAKVPGSMLRVAESTDKVCRIEAARHGQQPTTFSFSAEDAKNAGLLGKDNWRKYPRAMLRARCMTETCRAVFPDAVMGLYDPDELGAVTDSVGHVVDVRQVLSPHQAPDEEADAAPADGGALGEELGRILLDAKERLPVCLSYDEALALRAVLGTKAKMSDLTKRIQAGSESGDISPTQRAELGKLWQHCDRQVSKLEKQLEPGPEEVAHGMREPGEEG
jgi:hypothetical protein